ncbi:MAG: dihydropteroate synthase [Deltaproteobacteria bacterium]|nr:dihydropteroate synthase [Deltaproteobacteria bacterium]
MILISDNIHVMNPKVAKAMNDMDTKPIRDLASRIKNSGANIIDINPGPLRKDCSKMMAFLINSVQDATHLRLCLDTPNPEAIETGLTICKDKPIINGFSLEPHKMEKILPLAVDSDAETVGFLLHADGKVPRSLDERLALAFTLAREAKKAGLPPERLIIDPIVVPISWEDGTAQARDVLSCIRLLPDLLGFPVKTVVGLSNLTSGAGAKTASLLIEEAYLAMLAEAGLDIVLLNVLRKRSVATAFICDSIKNSRIWSWAEHDVWFLNT